MRSLTAWTARAGALAAFVLGSTQSVVLAQAQPAPLLNASGASLVRGGVLWTFEDGDFTLARLAEKAAPVLWMAPQEPLFSDEIRGPQAIPGDGDTKDAVVYYSVDAIALLKGTDGTNDSGAVMNTEAVWSWTAGPSSARDATRIVDIAIRYFFYYPRDIGHDHDLEGAEVHIVLSSDRKALRLARVAASAHGVSWLTNKLKITEQMDVAMPPHLFVEEGKHATAPDANGDGEYQHRRDVNAFLPDAWGMRDQGFLKQVTRFRGSMAKRRSTTNAVLPPRLADGVPDGASSYTLRDTGTSTLCRTGNKALDGYAEYMRFCEPPTVTFKKARANPFMRAVRTISPHHDEAYNGRPYTTFQMQGLQTFKFDGETTQFIRAMPLTRVPGVDGWLVFRGAFPAVPSWPTQVWANDLLYSHSVAQVFDPYASVGWEDDSQEERNGRVAYELGIKIHIPFVGYQAVLPPLLTFRAGVRTSELRGIRDTRWVYEFGFGPW